MQLTYLIGAPGSGKSTLLAALTEGMPWYAHPKPFAKTIWGNEPEVVELGARRGSFSGTDALSMSVQPKAVEWLDFFRPQFVVGEGDRLATGTFFAAVAGLGYDLRVVLLETPAEVANGRRLTRAEQLGIAPQNATWVAGRTTKLANLGSWVTDRLDGSQSVAALVEAAHTIPVLDKLGATT